MEPGNHQKSRAGSLPWIIWGLAALFYAYEFFLQVSPSVMVPDLMHTFRLDAASLGNLTALYFYSYAIMQIPAGVFLDVLGPRRLLTIAISVCVIGALFFGFAEHLWMAQLGRLLIGFGSAFAALGTFKLAANWFPVNRFAFITGLTLTIGMSGAVIGGAPLAILVEHMGWRQSMLTLAIIGAILSTLIWLIVRDSPNAHKKPKRKILGPQDSIIKSLIYIFKKPQSWITAIYGGLMFGPTPAFAGLWGTPFIMAKYGLDRPVAAGAVSMIFIGWAIGSPIFGWISDHINRRIPTLYVGSVGALITIIFILYVNLPILALYIILFLFGFSSSGFLPAFSIIREISPPTTSATALGFMNMMNMVGVAVLQPLIGVVLDHYWNGAIHHHIRIYPIHAYHISLLILPVIIFIAILIIPFIKETYCKPLNLDSAVKAKFSH